MKCKSSMKGQQRFLRERSRGKEEGEKKQLNTELEGYDA